jgi:FHS family L-fucose permease-like MFS transporter
VYFAVAIFVWALVVVFYFARIPEISDDDMQALQETTTGALRHDEKPFWRQYRLFLAIWAQFMYVGAQGPRNPPFSGVDALVAIAAYFINYADSVAGFSDSKSSALLSVSQGMFAFGRFFATFCMRWLSPRYMLASYVTILIVLSALASSVNGTAGVVLYMCLFFFESLCYPTIFVLGLKGLGKYTKRGGGMIVQSIVGGAVFPPVPARFGGR